MEVTPVLIVDDSLMIIKIIKKALLTNTLDGYRFDEQNIFTAADGIEAFSLIGTKQHIKLIISDIYMPNLNGDEFIEILKDTGKLEDLEVVFVTTSSTKIALPNKIKEDILGVIYKPFRTESFIEKFRELQKLKSFKELELKEIKEAQIEKKKFLEKICYIYLEDLKLDWITDTLEVLIDESFSNEDISEKDYPEMLYFILSTYLFEIDIKHSIDAKKISCILKNNSKKIELDQNRFAFVKDFKSQISYINSNELEAKKILEALILPLNDKISIAATHVRNHNMLKSNLFAPYFEYIINEFTKLDCDFLDKKLEKLIIEQKEIDSFSKYLHHFISKQQIKIAIPSISKFKSLESEIVKKLQIILRNVYALSHYYCGNIEFYIWKKAKQSNEIYKYLKESMPKSIPCTSRFLLHKRKITDEKYKSYIPYEKQKVLVLSNSLDTLSVFKDKVSEMFVKWDFFCFTKISLLDAWLNSNKPDKIILHHNFKNLEFDNGLEFLQLAFSNYPIFQNIIKMDRLYIIAKEDDYEQTKKYQSSYNFSIIQEPLVLNAIYQTLLYD